MDDVGTLDVVGLIAVAAAVEHDDGGFLRYDIFVEVFAYFLHFLARPAVFLRIEVDVHGIPFHDGVVEIDSLSDRTFNLGECCGTGLGDVGGIGCAPADYYAFADGLVGADGYGGVVAEADVVTAVDAVPGRYAVHGADCHLDGVVGEFAAVGRERYAGFGGDNLVDLLGVCTAIVFIEYVGGDSLDLGSLAAVVTENAVDLAECIYCEVVVGCAVHFLGFGEEFAGPFACRLAVFALCVGAPYVKVGGFGSRNVDGD